MIIRDSSQTSDHRLELYILLFQTCGPFQDVWPLPERRVAPLWPLPQRRVAPRRVAP